MISVDQHNLHFVLAGRETGYVDCVVVTRIGPPPRQIVDGYVQMPDTWRYVERPLRTPCALTPSSDA